MIATLGPLPAEDKSVARYRQIEEHLRSLLESGELRPGARLPGIIALAKQWNTNYFTVHSALTPLENEGLVERTPRGTFIRQSKSRLLTAGIYFGRNPWMDSEASFYQQIYRELQTELESRDVRSRFFIDERSTEEQLSPLPEMSRAIAQREVQGVIGLMLNFSDFSWLRKLGIPTSLMFSNGHDGNLETLKKIVLDRLAAEGCKKVAMIVRTSEDIYPSLKQMAEARGMTTRPEWLRQPGFPMSFREEEFGYRSFKEIWALPERPDSLVVYPDWGCRGVITAVLEQGVKVPGELKLALFRNAGLEFICPWPVPMVVSDVRQVAKGIVDHLFRQAGPTPGDCVLPPSPLQLIG